MCCTFAGMRKKTFDEQKVGGLRSTAKAVLRMPGHKEIGPPLRRLVHEYLTSQKPFQQELQRAIRKEPYEKAWIDESIQELILVVCTRTRLFACILPALFVICSRSVDQTMGDKSRGSGSTCYRMVPDRSTCRYLSSDDRSG